MARSKSTTGIKITESIMQSAGPAAAATAIEPVMARLERQAKALTALGCANEPLVVTANDLEEVIGWALDHYSKPEEIQGCKDILKVIQDARDCFKAKTAGVFGHPLEIV